MHNNKFDVWCKVGKRAFETMASRQHFSLVDNNDYWTVVPVKEKFCPDAFAKSFQFLIQSGDELTFIFEGMDGLAYFHVSSERYTSLSEEEIFEQLRQ